VRSRDRPRTVIPLTALCVLIPLISCVTPDDEPGPIRWLPRGDDLLVPDRLLAPGPGEPYCVLIQIMASKEVKLLPQLAFSAVEPLFPAPAGGSASRSRASRDNGLPARLSGGGMEKWRLAGSIPPAPRGHPWPSCRNLESSQDLFSRSRVKVSSTAPCSSRKPNGKKPRHASSGPCRRGLVWAGSKRE
jgi:hypothetical protein